MCLKLQNMCLIKPSLRKDHNTDIILPMASEGDNYFCVTILTSCGDKLYNSI